MDEYAFRYITEDRSAGFRISARELFRTGQCWIGPVRKRSENPQSKWRPEAILINAGAARRKPSEKHSDRA